MTDDLRWGLAVVLGGGANACRCSSVGRILLILCWFNEDLECCSAIGGSMGFDAHGRGCR
jgi:hypothetical protein